MQGLVTYLIIIIFSIILREFISPLSFVLIFIGANRPLFRRYINQLAINLLCLIIFAYYFSVYGKLITPEVGLNFLLNVILLKFLESKSYRDDVMSFFGIILLLSAGSLFEKTLVYFIFFTISFVILLHFHFKLNQISLFSKSNLKQYILSSFIVLALFFVFPRIQNPIPFSLNTRGEGEIGYSPEINISEIESLVENDAKVFWAKIPEIIPREDLYWRGNVVSSTDGWNWSSSMIEQGFVQSIPETTAINPIEYRLMIATPYYFVLDQQNILNIGSQYFKSDQTNTFSSNFIRHRPRYQSFHKDIHDKQFIENIENITLQKELVDYIHRLFPDNELNDLIKTYKEKLQQEDFKYSWTPGRVRNLEEFFEKKVGFCTHYASSLGLILRAKGFNVRLVSGFQGGRYNPYGNFYEISQNDAHAWVEVFNEGMWVRIDPTSFIAPNRISMDFTNIVKNNFEVPGHDIQSRNQFINNLRFIINQWDFEFYQMMDQWDSSVQAGFFNDFNISRRHLYIMSACTILIFIISLLLFNKKRTLTHKLWREYLRKLKKNNISFKGSFNELREDIINSQSKQKDMLLTLSKLFMEHYYQGSSKIDLIRKILKKSNQ